MSSDGKEAFAKELESHGLGRLAPLLAEQDVISMDDLQGLHDDDVSEFIAELASTKDKLKLGEKAKLRNLVKELRAKAERKKAAEAPAPAPAPVPDEPMMAPQPFPLAPDPYGNQDLQMRMSEEDALVIRHTPRGVLYGRMGGRRQLHMNHSDRDKGLPRGGCFGPSPIATVRTNVLNVKQPKGSKGMAVKETARRQQPTTILKSQLRLNAVENKVMRQAEAIRRQQPTKSRLRLNALEERVTREAEAIRRRWGKQRATQGEQVPVQRD